jgi:choice-of-anchor A domain-containing protein
MAKRLNRLLAALAATATLATGITASAWAGTATATEYITIQPESGTTLDGRTFNAYRLGSYGKADIRTDMDSGDKYAADIPVAADSDKKDALAEAGDAAGFTGDNPLAKAWASTDSSKLQKFAQSLARSLDETTPDANITGAGDLGPFAPGVYLIAGSDGSVCLSGTLPSEGVGDRKHALGEAVFKGDAVSTQSANETTSDGSLTLADGYSSFGKGNRSRAVEQQWHALFSGSMTSSALDNKDPAISVYTGGNMRYENNLETEGSVIVNGNLTNGHGLVSGKVNWGMGYTPPAGAVTLAVGGNYTSKSTTNGNNWNIGYTSGNAQIGGSDNRVVTLSPGTTEKYGVWSTWNISGQTNVKSTSNMGRENALKVDIDGKGTIVDYNDYVNRQLKPLSKKFAAKKATGTVSYKRGSDTVENVWLQLGADKSTTGRKDTVSVSADEGVITFTGDGKKHTQVFNLDMDEVARQKSSLKVLQWGVDFENVPGNTAIVVNVKGSGARTWDTGWRYWVNGKKVNIAINQTDGTYQDFRTLASRVMWNWTDASSVHYDESHGIMHINKDAGHSMSQDGKDAYHGGSYGTSASPGKASNLPGSVLAANSDVTMECDQNGRLLVGKNLTLNVWEHHNNPWIGFNDQNSIAVQAATTASHDGVDLGTKAAVHDSIALKNTGSAYGAKIAKITVRLNYSKDTDGTTASQSAVKTTSAVTVGAGSTATVDSPDFTPSDLEMSAWQAGRYWFDISVTDSDVSLTGLTANETADIHDSQSLNGLDDQSEQWTIQPGATPSIGTKAVASGATAGGTQPVHDSITVTNPDPNRAVTLNKVTTTLHVKGGKTASKTVTGKTIPAGGSLTFDSATFTPSDLGDKTWKAGVTYWFDATVKASDASYPSGAQALTADLNHDGSNDAAQQFKLTMDADFSTKAQDTFTQAGGTGAVHDRLLLKSGSDALTADLDVRVTLNWNASPTGTAGTKSLTKAGVFKAGAASSDLPDFTPSDFGWTSWKGGRYWYDVTIPAQNGISSTTLKGLQKDVAAESWTAAVPWTLDLAKLAYIGQPGSGRWDDEPVKGATFTLTETTDRTGGTAVSGAKTLTVTTDRNGRAHLTDGTIATDGVKWFKLVETQAPSSYKTPDAGTFWMVKVTGSADGATVTVTGSDKTAQALLKSVDGSTLTVGDQFQGNIMPPLTGGTYDVMRGLALAGGIMLAMLAGGVLWTRRRTDARHAR